jgi:hypothetical protein
MNFQEAANRVKSNLSPETEQVFIDPATIILICSILSAIFNGIRLYCQLKKGKEVQTVAAHPSLRAKFFVHRRVRQYLSKEEYKKHGEEVVQAILNAGKDATPEEIEELMRQSELS